MTTERTFAFLMILALLPAAAACGSDSESTPADGSTGGAGNAQPVSWDNTTYKLQIPSSSWSEPQGVGAEISDFVPPFLLSVATCANDTCGLMLGTADSAGAQQMCNATVNTNATGTPPAVQIGPLDFPMYIKHVSQDVSVYATAYDLTITNVLPSSNGIATAGELAATMDVRELYPMFTMVVIRTPDTVCEAFASQGADCTACADGQPYCLTLKAIRLGAIEIPDLTLEAVDSAATGAECAPRG